jgi:RNA polymerase sigma-70 factor, ECF subfamily
MTIPYVEELLSCCPGGTTATVGTKQSTMTFDSMMPAEAESRPRSSPSEPDALLNLLAGIRARDAAALEALYDATCSRLYSLASAILRSREDAEEVVCDCFTQAWNEAARYDATRASVLGWLMMLCRSRALDRLRQRRHHQASAGIEAAEAVPDPGPGPDELLSMVEQGSRVHAALAALPEDRRELIALAFLGGLSHQEIADLKRLPLGTVKSHIRRSLTQLRDALDVPPGKKVDTP